MGGERAHDPEVAVLLAERQTYPAHMHIHGTLLDEYIFTPNPVEHFVAREDAIGMGEE